MGALLVMMKLKMRPIGWSTGQEKAQYSRTTVKRVMMMRGKRVKMLMMLVVMHPLSLSQDIPLLVHRQTILGMA